MGTVHSLAEARDKRKATTPDTRPISGHVELTLGQEQPPGVDFAALKAKYDENMRRLADERARANKGVLRSHGMEPTKPTK